jgi:hypothetical protein
LSARVDPRPSTILSAGDGVVAEAAGGEFAAMEISKGHLKRIGSGETAEGKCIST